MKTNREYQQELLSSPQDQKKLKVSDSSSEEVKKRQNGSTKSGGQNDESNKSQSSSWEIQTISVVAQDAPRYYEFANARLIAPIFKYQQEESEFSDLTSEPENVDWPKVDWEKLAQQLYSIKRESRMSKSRIQIPNFQTIATTQKYQAAGITQYYRNKDQAISSENIRSKAAELLGKEGDKISQLAIKSIIESSDKINETKEENLEALDAKNSNCMIGKEEDKHNYWQLDLKAFCTAQFCIAFNYQGQLSAQQLIQKGSNKLLSTQDTVYKDHQDLTEDSEFIKEILRSKNSIEDAINIISRKLDLMQKVFSEIRQSKFEIGNLSTSLVRNLDSENLGIKSMTGMKLLPQCETYDLTKQLLVLTLIYLYPQFIFENE